jgi:hypothetical protein
MQWFICWRCKIALAWWATIEGKNEKHEREEKEGTSAVIKRSSFIEILSLSRTRIAQHTNILSNLQRSAANMKTGPVLQVNDYRVEWIYICIDNGCKNDSCKIREHGSHKFCNYSYYGRNAYISHRSLISKFIFSTVNKINYILCVIANSSSHYYTCMLSRKSS